MAARGLESEPRSARLLAAALAPCGRSHRRRCRFCFYPTVLANAPRHCLPRLFPITKKFVKIKASHLSNKTLQVFGPLCHEFVTVRWVSGRAVPQPRRATGQRADLRTICRDLCHPTQQLDIDICRSVCCCLVKFAWSVQLRDLIGPNIFRCARLPANWANASSVNGGHAC